MPEDFELKDLGKIWTEGLKPMLDYCGEHLGFHPAWLLVLLLVGYVIIPKIIRAYKGTK